MVRDELAEHRREPVDRVGRAAVGPGQAADRVVRAVHLRAAVDEEQARHDWSPERSISFARCASGSWTPCGVVLVAAGCGRGVQPIPSASSTSTKSSCISASTAARPCRRRVAFRRSWRCAASRSIPRPRTPVDPRPDAPPVLERPAAPTSASASRGCARAASSSRCACTADDVRQLSACGPLSWSSYSFDDVARASAT